MPHHDAAGRVKQAGAIAVRGTKADLEVAVVRARKNPQDWIFPKGHVESGETLEQAALRELREEAGIVGELVGHVGVSEFVAGDEVVAVTYFLARAVGSHRDRERETLWLPVNRALDVLTYDDAKQHLERARGLLDERRA